jgi:hypothetical protein
MGCRCLMMSAVWIMRKTSVTFVGSQLQKITNAPSVTPYLAQKQEMTNYEQNSDRGYRQTTGFDGGITTEYRIKNKTRSHLRFKTRF